MTAWEPNDPAVATWIEAAVGRGARVVSIERMPPSATDQHRVVVSFDDNALALVLRRYHDAERLGVDPWYEPANEVRALQLLEPTLVPAPRLLASDLDAAVCDVPALLESWVDGEKAWRPGELDAYLRGAAEMLVWIHAIDAERDGPFPPYRPYVADEDEALADGLPAWSKRRSMWARVFDLAGGPWPASRDRFIHRDYHPGNALWDGARVSAVVDWPTAASGPPGIDLARMRQNLAGWHGLEAADGFTRCYVEAGGDPAARNPFWDLLDAADSVAFTDEPGAPGDGDVDRFEDYVASVLSEL